jgi:pyrophosphate--fructose-6-phosphate 1-phosphotransferase
VNNNKSALQKARLAYEPKLPKALRSGKIKLEFGKPTTAADSPEQIEKLFPATYGQPLATIVEGDGNLTTEAINVGVVLSGGQAPGGHNVIAGLFDALKAANPQNKLYGFLGGPIGVIKG